MFNDKRCVLIVDDDIKILRSLKDFLKGNDFYVLEATDGRMALDVFYKNNTKVDLILLDVMMPDTDGFAALKVIRESSLVPVIMLTARGEEYDQLNGFKQGADDYIPKPFSPSLLLARMEAVLKRVGKNEANELTAGGICVNILRLSIDFYGVSGLLHAISDAGYRAEIGRSFDAESESGGSEAMLFDWSIGEK